jgi:hypothetical protein
MKREQAIRQKHQFERAVVNFDWDSDDEALFVQRRMHIQKIRYND